MADRLRFYLDQHISPAVAEGLRRRGIDVVTASEVDRCGQSDPNQLRWGANQSRVVVTFDADFLALAAAGTPHAGIAFCPATKYSAGQLIYALLLAHDILTPADMVNHVEFL